MSEISPAADQSRTFSVKVALKEGQSVIQLGQSARVFFNQNIQNVLSIPLSSVSATNKQAYVWVVNSDQRIHKVAVTLGAYGRQCAYFKWFASWAVGGCWRCAFASRKTKN